MNGDDEKLFTAALYLLENEQKRCSLGLHAKRVLDTYFSVESAVNHLIYEILQGS